MPCRKACKTTVTTKPRGGRKPSKGTGVLENTRKNFQSRISTGTMAVSPKIKKMRGGEW
jgi:hypothetical protein